MLSSAYQEKMYNCWYMYLNIYKHKFYTELRFLSMEVVYKLRT